MTYVTYLWKTGKKYRYQPVIKWEEDTFTITGDVFLMSKSIFTQTRIGGVYEIEIEGDNVKYSKNAPLLGYIRDRDVILENQTSDKAEKEKERLLKYVSELKMETLEPFRQAYKKAAPVNRTIILADIIDHITR